jgi:hypothetical protein
LFYRDGACAAGTLALSLSKARRRRAASLMKRFPLTHGFVQMRSQVGLRKRPFADFNFINMY